MEILYISVGLVCVFLIYNLIILPIVMNKKLKSLFNDFNQSYTIENYKNKNYNYTMEDKDKKIYIKVISIPRNSQVTINNVSTWRLQWGGNSLKLGRSYPNARYMEEVIKFIQEDISIDKPLIKLIMLYPNTEKILRYINESDLEIITPDKTPYGYKVTTFTKFKEQFEILSNIK